MTPPPWSDLLMTRLFHGKDRAVTIGTLQEQWGVPRRVVEQAVEQARLEGKPIVTGSAGVWISYDGAELEAAAKSLQSRGVRIIQGSRALRQTARRQQRAAQMEMFG